MKHKLLHLQSLVAVALCVIMAIAFTSCSDDDDEPAADELTTIIVGTWAQDGDNDILVINKGGSGAVYDRPSDYYDKNSYGSINWEYKNGFLFLDIGFYGGFYGDIQKEKLRAVSVSKNEIKWYRYESDEDGYFSNEYEEWTWTRYE